MLQLNLCVDVNPAATIEIVISPLMALAKEAPFATAKIIDPSAEAVASVLDFTVIPLGNVPTVALPAILVVPL